MQFQRLAESLLLLVAAGALTLLPCASSALRSKRFVEIGDSTQQVFSFQLFCLFSVTQKLFHLN